MNSYIDDIDQQIAQLKARRKKLVRLERLNLTKTMAETLCVIKNNPGIDNTGIQETMGFDDKTYLNTMIALRRNRNLIENRGTRNSPKWYPKET